MATTAIEGNDAAPDTGMGKSSKLILLGSLLLCLLGATAGFFSVSSGLLPFANPSAVHLDERPAAEAVPDIAFVPIPTLIVTLPPDAENDHLRFSAQIEVIAGYQGDVEFLMPRIQDILNGYLRALKAKDIEGTAAIFRVRRQLHQRIVSVVGLGKTNGLLITEFILK